MEKFILERRGDNYWIYTPSMKKQMLIHAYKFLETEYKNFGYDTKEEFIYAYAKRELTLEEKYEIDKLKNYEHKIDGYKTKLLNDKKMMVREQIKEKHGNLFYKEREKIVKRAINNPSGKAIRWRYLKDLKVDEIESLKRKLKLKKRDIRKIINKIEIDEEFQTIKELFEYFGSLIDPMDYINGLSVIEWTECPIIKGHTSHLKIYKDKYKILSSNPKTQAGVMFDLIDLFTIYNIDMFQVIDRIGIKVKEYEIIKEEQAKLAKEKKRFRKMFRDIQNKNIANKYPTLSKHMKSLLDVYIKLLEQGVVNARHTGQLKNGKCVYFTSIRDLVEAFEEEGITVKKSSIGNKINMLCCLGLLEKVFTKELPVGLRPDKKKVYRQKDWYNNNYFILPDVNFEEIEKIAILLKDGNITLRNFSKKAVKEVFGQEMVDKVFQSRKAKLKNNDEKVTADSIEDTKQIASNKNEGNDDYDYEEAFNDCDCLSNDGSSDNEIYREEWML